MPGNDGMSYPQSDADFQDPRLPGAPRSNPCLILVVVLGAAGLLCAALCCGAGVWIVGFGMSVVSADIENQLRDHPQIREHLGTIQSLKVDWPKSIAEEDYDTWTYDVRGDKGSGELIVVSVSGDEGEILQSVTLRKSTGEVIELDLSH